MGETEYSEALKLGKKEYRARIAKGQFPYLPVLDEILSEADIKTEQNMGLVQVPLDFVVGTSTMGRTYSFAANFMPILDEETEFAVKWSNLSDAQMNEDVYKRQLAIHPASTTHSECNEAELLDQGIKPNTIRLSIGTENVDDIIEDLDEAFKALEE